jgi:hypothetical protein
MQAVREGTLRLPFVLRLATFHLTIASLQCP